MTQIAFLSLITGMWFFVIVVVSIFNIQFFHCCIGSIEWNLKINCYNPQPNKCLIFSLSCAFFVSYVLFLFLIMFLKRNIFEEFSRACECVKKIKPNINLSYYSSNNFKHCFKPTTIHRTKVFFHVYENMYFSHNNTHISLFLYFYFR